MARTSIPAPDLQYVLALRTEMERMYADDDAQIDRTRSVRTLSRPTLVDDRYRVNDVEVRDPTLADEIQRVVAALSINPPRLRVTPARPGDTAEANATLRERWSEAVLEVAGRHPTGHTRQQLVDACAGDGGGWTKVLFKSDLWSERYGLKLKLGADDSEDDKAVKADEYDRLTEEAKKAAGPPFVWKSVDVRTIYPQWTDGKLQEVLEVQQRPLHAALRDWRLGLKRNKRGELSLVPMMLGEPMNKLDARKIPHTMTFLEHWDAEWVTYILLLPGGEAGADARVVKQFRHKYGRVPYFYAPGFTFNWATNRKVGWGVGESKRWLVEYLSYLETLHAQVAARDAFSPLVRTMPELALGNYGDNAAPTSPEYWEIRQVYNLKPGEQLNVLQFPGVGPALKEQIAMTKQAITDLLSPRVSPNIGGGMEGAGFAINQVLAEARVGQDPICKHLEQCLGEISDFLWKLVREKVQETVWVFGPNGRKGSTWMGAGPDDLTPNVMREWQMDPERPSAKLIEERYWHERIEKGTAGRHQAIVEMGDNPDEVDDDREMDRIRQTQWYQQRHDEQLLQKLERGDILYDSAMAAIQSGNLPGQPGTGGMPMPGNPQALNPGMAGPPQPGAPGAGAQGMGTRQVPDMGRQATQPAPGRPGGPTPMAGPAGTPPAQSAAGGAQGLVR